MSDRVVVIREHDTPVPVASQPGTLVVARAASEAVVVSEAPPATITVTEQAETVVVREVAPTVVAIASPAQGPAGVGPPGTAGQPRWSGEGSPTLIIGASPGDEYIDTLTGDIYRLS